MRIIGVDSGTLVTGFGVIDSDARQTALVEYGVVRTKASMPMPMRLRDIHVQLLEVMARTQPDEFAIESAFYAKNVQSMLKLGSARGVAILAAALRDLPVSEYAPREVKMSVTGTGGATKQQVEYMVMRMLALHEKRHTLLDATDALAVALCHAHRRDAPAKGSRDWKRFVEEHPERIVSSR